MRDNNDNGVRIVNFATLKNLVVKRCAFLDQRKHAKMHWVHDPNQSNVGNINHVGRDARRHFRNKKKEYLKVKLRN